MQFGWTFVKIFDMSFVTAKRITHLARYFGVLAVLILLGYHYTNSFYFMALLGPSHFLVYWFRVHADSLAHWIPNEPLYNNFLLIYPVTVIYFGLVGFQLKNLVNERGRLRLLSILVFLAFLAYIHFLAYKEIGLYWEGGSFPSQ